MSWKAFCDKCGLECSDSKIMRTFIAEDGQRYTIELMVRNPNGEFGILCISCARDIIESDV